MGVSLIPRILSTTMIQGARDFDGFQPEPTKKTRLAYDSGFCSFESQQRLSSRQCPNTSPPGRLQRSTTPPIPPGDTQPASTEGSKPACRYRISSLISFSTSLS